tara:strand:- start:81 stop:530 length:450 start_codon:yes stop_codon:yes gene_type:complete
MIINKYKLLQNLSETYCTYGVSKVHGVGVFAMRDIPKNTNPFPSIKNEMCVKLTDKDIMDLPEEVICKIKDIFIKKEGVYNIYNLGLNSLGVRFHVNHSKEPNIILTPTTGETYSSFTTIKKIKKGEELFWNYKTSDGENILDQYKFIK